MAVAFVRSTETRVSTGSVSSITLTISASAGQFAAVFGFPSGGSSTVPVSSITDTGSNTWAIPGNYGSTTPPAEYTGGSGAFIAYSNVGTAFTSVTVNIPTANEFTVCVAVFSGVKTSFPLRQGAVGISTSTPTVNAIGGDLVLGIANTSNATSISGMSTLTTDHGNLAGYGIPGPTENVTMTWSPSQSAPAGIAEFLIGATTVNGTATLTDAESLTANATIAPIASLVEAESLTAVPGANPHVAFSSVVPAQLDPNGIPLTFGHAAYNYTSPTATTYDHWVALQDGQLASGAYNAASDTSMVRTAAGIWVVGNAVQLTNQSAPSTPSGGGVLYSNSGVAHWKDTGGLVSGMVRSYTAASTSPLNNFSTETDVPGASVSITVTGSNSTLVVHANWDFNASTTAALTFVGFFNWNGVDQAKQAVLVTTTLDQRASVSQNYQITGITAGTYTAKLRASCSTSGNLNRVENPHTSFTAILIEQ